MIWLTNPFLCSIPYMYTRKLWSTCYKKWGFSHSDSQLHYSWLAMIYQGASIWVRLSCRPGRPMGNWGDFWSFGSGGAGWSAEKWWVPRLQVILFPPKWPKPSGWRIYCFNCTGILAGGKSSQGKSIPFKTPKKGPLRQLSRDPPNHDLRHTFLGIVQ